MILKWKKCLQKHFLYLHFVQSNICVLKYSIFQRERLNKMNQHSKDTLCQLCQHGTCCFQEIYSWVPIILFVTMITELLGWWCFDCVWKGLELLCGHTVESTKFGFLLACHPDVLTMSQWELWRASQRQIAGASHHSMDNGWRWPELKRHYLRYWVSVTRM